MALSLRLSRAVRSSSSRFISFAPSSSPFLYAAGVHVKSSQRYMSTEQVAEKVEKVEEVKPVVPVEPEELKLGNLEKKEFQAETRQLLDIVTNSLYTDKEVFVRELISNASDALEKLRYLESTNTKVLQPERPLEIRITTNETNHTITITDSGLGMTASEIVDNLGTIARSGSKNFVKSLKEKSSTSAETNIIGQFGVGFYASFMVCEKVEVFSQSHTGAPASYWVSDGLGQYEISGADKVNRGTKIILTLKPAAYEFAIRHNIERIVKKYSNFVGFPIYLNEEKVNTVRAIWLDDKSSITPIQYEEFYRHLTNSFDKPCYTHHYHTDAPLSIHALFYIPESNGAKFGLGGRPEPSVNLYSRKVLIQAKCPTILPEWLSFVKGVVDSEDIPLNISRETMQDSALIKRIKGVLTRKLLNFLDTEGIKNPTAYNKFFAEFSNFFKEGIVSDSANKEAIAKLLRFETSNSEAGKLSSLDDYISRMPAQQQDIFFLCMPNRAACESSPYFEQFKANNVEVLFAYTNVDDVVMKTLAEYSRRKLVSVESSEAGKDLKVKNADDTPQADESSVPLSEKKLNSEQTENLLKFLERTLSARASSVTVSTRLVSSPAIILDHESASMRKILAMMDESKSLGSMNRKQKMEINPNHIIMKKLAHLASREDSQKTAVLVAEQIFDNAMIAAGLMDDPRVMLNRLNSLLEHSMSNSSASPVSASPAVKEEAKVVPPVTSTPENKVEDKPDVVEAQWQEVVKKL